MLYYFVIDVLQLLLMIVTEILISSVFYSLVLLFSLQGTDLFHYKFLGRKKKHKIPMLVLENEC